MGVTKFVEGNLPSLDMQRRMSEDVSDEGRRGSTDSTELDAEIKKARAAYLGESDDNLSTDSERRVSDADADGDDKSPGHGKRTSKKATSKKSITAGTVIHGGAMKKSNSKTTITPEIITAGALPSPPPPLNPSSLSAATIKVPKPNSKRGSKGPVDQLKADLDDDDSSSSTGSDLNTESKEAKRRSLTRVKSMKEKSSSRLNSTSTSTIARGSIGHESKKHLSKAGDLGVPPPLMFPPEPLVLPSADCP